MLPVRLWSSLCVLGETRLGALFFLPMVAGAAARRDDRGWEKAAGPARPRRRAASMASRTAAAATLSEHLAGARRVYGRIVLSLVHACGSADDWCSWFASVLQAA